MSSTGAAGAVPDNPGPVAVLLLSKAGPLEEVGLICGRLNAAHADLIALVGRLFADQSWEIAGIRSLEHWLTCFAGVSPSMARDLTRIATRSTELPALRREVATGRLALGQAAVVAAHTPVGYDEDVVGLAVHATVPQLRRALVKYDFTEPSQAEAAPELLSVAALPAELSMRYEKDRFHLEYSAPADIGALVERTLIEAKDALFLATQGGANGPDQRDNPDLPTPRRVRLADAVEQMAIRSLQIGSATTTGRADTFRIYLHPDTTGHGWLEKRGALPHHLLRKWTCNGIVQPVWETGGSPVNIGRAQRIVPRRTRRLVEDRDRGCAFPGCLAIHHLECHHITHWADGGPTDMGNLVSLCPHHHDRHHTGDFSIHPASDRPRQFVFESRGRYRIGPVTPDSPPPTNTPPSHAPLRDAPVPDASAGLVTSERPHYTGPADDVLRLDWVRFRRRRNPQSGESPDPNPSNGP